MIERQKTTRSDIISGTRYAPGGGVAGWDLKRVVISRTANFIAQVLLGVNSTDLTGSYRLYKRETLEEVINEVRAKGYVFQMEILVRALKKGYTVVEQPIMFVDRLYGSSKLGTGEIIGYLKGLFTLFWEL